MGKLGALKAFFADSVLSLVAYALPVCALYFFIQPGIAGKLGGEGYGVSLTFLALMQFFDTALVSTLASTRLLRSREDGSETDARAFLAVALLVVCCASIALLCVVQYLLGIFTVVDFGLTSFAFVLMSIFDYFVIEFRVLINYRRILACNVALVFGYAIGFLTFFYFGKWELVFIVGYGVGDVLLLCLVKPWRSPVGNPDRKAISRQYGNYVGANAVTALVSYGDRLILFPLLGPFEVSVYSSASVASKVIGMITTPMNNVLLSYLVKKDQLRARAKTVAAVMGILIFAIAVTVVCFIPISTFLSGFLYPQWASEAKVLIPVIVLAVVLSSYSNVVNTFVLRYGESSFQLRLSVVRLAVFAVLCIALALKFGLMGFCVGFAITELVRFGILAWKLVRLLLFGQSALAECR
ncbi:MAG: hypothetical protein HFJ66_01460 [Eggerthellaceae bacterium]|nr:hypothetical protein [Eggerthellaceae bacterium]